MTPARRPAVIALCGNPDAGADAFGPMVGRALRPRDAAARIVHVGTDAMGLLDYLADATGLILVDAVWCPQVKRGTLIDLDWRSEARPALISERGASSSHGISLGMALDLADRLGMLPQQVCLIGVTVDCAELGTGVDAAVRASVPEACARICSRVDSFSQAMGAATRA